MSKGSLLLEQLSAYPAYTCRRRRGSMRVLAMLRRMPAHGVLFVS